MKFALATVAVAALMAPALPAFAQQTVAVVDLQRAIRNSKEGKAAEAKLQEMGNQKRDEFKPKEEQIQRMQEELETQKFVLSKDARQERELELLKRKRSLERDLEEAQEELQIEERKLTQPIIENIIGTVKAVARDKKYTAVLARNNPILIYHSEELDITDEVIKRLDEN